MKESMSNALMVVAVVCALTTTGLVARRELMPPEDPAIAGYKVPQWRDVAVGRPLIGDSTAKVTVVEFFDFQCPACRRMSYAIDSLLARRPDGIRLIRRHFPITAIHPAAYDMALASSCTDSIAQRGEYYTAAFHRQREIGLPAWRGPLSLVAPSDSATIRRCMGDPAIRRRVDADIAAGLAIGIRGTPALLVNGRLFEGARPLATLDSIIARAR